MTEPTPSTQYATDVNLAARQRLWWESRREPPFDLFDWVLGVAGLASGPRASGERILEVGCGNGAYLERIEGAVGLDASFGMVATARGRTGARVLQGDVTALPFADGAWDVVLAPHMLYHVDDRAAAARELRRVTRPGGRCVAVTNSEANHTEFVALVERVVGERWRMRRPSDVAFSVENGAEQLAAGFDVVERVDCPPGVFHVTDPDAFADYVASIADHYEAQVAGWISWADVVEACRAEVAAVVRDRGAFRISAAMGGFVCR